MSHGIFPPIPDNPAGELGAPGGQAFGGGGEAEALGAFSPGIEPGEGSVDLDDALDDELADEGGERMYGTFKIGPDAFTLTAKEIREVVAYPDHIVPIPQSPSYLAGMFCLRGEVIPVIDAAKLLGLEEPPTHTPGESRIAIIDCGDRCAGMIFESTQEVLEVQDEQIQSLNYGIPGSGAQLVTGIVKLDDGERLVQILSGPALAHLEGIPWGAISESSPAEEDRDDDEEDDLDSTQFVVATVGVTSIAIDVGSVLEIHEYLDFKNGTGHQTSGGATVQLRGMTVFVMDLFNIMTGESRRPTDDLKLVFVHDKERVCALLVDTVLDVIHIDERSVVGLKALSDYSIGRYSSQVVNLPQHGSALILDILQLFEMTGFQGTPASFGGESLIALSDHGDDQEEDDDEDIHSQSFLAFGVGEQTFCLDLTAIQEIQDLPTQLLRAPGGDEALLGIMNLRGSVVPIMDLRVCYGLQGRTPPEGSKVIIASTAGELRGYAVDELVGIHHTSENASVEPRSSVGLLLRNSEGKQPFADHASGALHIKNDASSGVLIILDPERFGGQRGALAA